jgi:hypothetical protein
MTEQLYVFSPGFARMPSVLRRGRACHAGEAVLLRAGPIPAESKSIGTPLGERVLSSAMHGQQHGFLSRLKLYQRLRCSHYGLCCTIAVSLHALNTWHAHTGL